MLDGVAQEVADDAADAARIHTDLEVAAGRFEPQFAPVLFGEGVHPVDRVLSEAHEVGRLRVEHDRSRVVAADLEEVGQQQVEPFDLGVQEFRRALGRRGEGLALVVDDVAGESDGRERRPEFVGHIGYEPLLKLRQGGQLVDLALEAVGHPVERPRQRREHVFALLGHPHREVPRRQPLARLRRHPDRAHDEPHDDPRHGADQQDEGEACEEQRVLHEDQRVLRVAEVVADVQLVVADDGEGQLRSHDDPGVGRAAGADELHRLVELLGAAVLHLCAELAGDDVAGESWTQPVRGSEEGRILSRHTECGDQPARGRRLHRLQGGIQKVPDRVTPCDV